MFSRARPDQTRRSNPSGEASPGSCNRPERDEDRELVQGFLKLLIDNGLGYTGSFRRLSRGETPSVDDDGWAARYRARLALEP